jgi:hypothetical protein
MKKTPFVKYKKLTCPCIPQPSPQALLEDFQQELLNISDLQPHRAMMKHIKSSGRLCGLVVNVPGYISRGTGSIPGATRFSEK